MEVNEVATGELLPSEPDAVAWLAVDTLILSAGTLPGTLGKLVCGALNGGIEFPILVPAAELDETWLAPGKYTDWLEGMET